MHPRYLLTSFCIFLTTAFSFAQFGTDVIIEQDTVDQRNVEITTAFNGWIFSAFSTVNTATNSGGITIRKSTDGGLTWTTIDSYSVPNVRYDAFDLVVAGTDENALTLYLTGVNHNLGNSSYIIYVDRYNATTGSFIGSTYNLNKGTDKVYDVEIASDYKAPAVGVSPYSVQLVYSCFSNVYDSIVGITSIDGGSTFTNRQAIATTTAFFKDVTVDYGRSNSASNGRYFVAWMRRTNSTARTGNIFTARNSSFVSGGWTAPDNLDSISASMIGLCSNPRIAVQQNDTDNDSASVTAIITVDRNYDGLGTDYDVLGFYNKRAHFTDFWYRFDVTNAGTFDFSADVVYEDTNQLFHLVYADSTSRQLKYMTNDMNLTSPSGWTLVQSDMNDDSTVVHPMPRIVFRPGVNEAGIAWVTEGAANNGVALFDIDHFADIIGIGEHNELEALLYPNPVTDELFVQLSGEASALETELVITDLNGRIMLRETLNGQTLFSARTDAYANGTYILTLSNSAGAGSRLFVKE